MKWTAMLRNGLVLGSFVCLAGCPAPETETAPVPMCQKSPSIIPQDGPTGAGGTNGLDAELFHQYSLTLFAATQTSLKEPMTAANEKGEYLLNPQIKDLLLQGGDNLEIRQEILNHALQCAMPSTMSFTDGTNVYRGSVLDAEENLQDPSQPTLTTTGAWLEGPLSQSAVEDLFTCMAILLNPKYKHVPVFLSGPSVRDHAESTGPYHFAEAVWSAEVDSAGGVRYHVWPLLTGPDLPEDCLGDQDIANAFKVRVCGSVEADCGLDVRLNHFEEECEPDVIDDGGHFKCTLKDAPGGPTRSAIRTMLKTQCDVRYVYCPVAPQ